jgi:hypothetical protein
MALWSYVAVDCFTRAVAQGIRKPTCLCREDETRDAEGEEVNTQGPDEREDLEALLASPGWIRFHDYVKAQWAVGYPARIKMAIKDAQEKNTNVAEAVHRIDAANDEVNAMLSWPKQRLQSLEAHANVGRIVSLGRGGQ